eukprot:scaffold73622_cov52-Phaeocystis_antarctica.AAC.5
MCAVEDRPGMRSPRALFRVVVRIDNVDGFEKRPVSDIEPWILSPRAPSHSTHPPTHSLPDRAEEPARQLGP